MANRLARLIKNEDELKIDEELTLKLKAKALDYVDVQKAISELQEGKITSADATGKIIEVIARMAIRGSNLNDEEADSLKILLLTKRGDLVFEALEKLGFVKEGTFRKQIEELRKAQGL